MADHRYRNDQRKPILTVAIDDSRKLSPIAGIQRGAVMWEVTGGEGRLAGAQGLITSNFTVGAQGEVVDDQFARLFVP